MYTSSGYCLLITGAAHSLNCLFIPTAAPVTHMGATMFAFQKFQPVYQTDTQSDGIVTELIDGFMSWRASRRERRAEANARPLLMLADAGQLRPMPVLALPPPSIAVDCAPPPPSKRAKRRGKYRTASKLYWVLEIDGRVVTTTDGKERRFPTKAAALAFNA